jgi:hypothetical protein
MPSQNKQEEPISTFKEPELDNQQETSFRKPIQEKDLLTWNAPTRPFKRRDREFWVTTIAMAGIAGLILFLVEGFMPVILIISIVFLFYILSTVEPEETEYKITNKGIKIAGKRTDWENMLRFWFAKRFDSDLLVFETLGLGGRMELVINPKDKEKLKKVVSNYLAEEEVSPSNIDKLASWFSKKLPQ